MCLCMCVCLCVCTNCELGYNTQTQHMRTHKHTHNTHWLPHFPKSLSHTLLSPTHHPLLHTPSSPPHTLLSSTHPPHPHTPSSPILASVKSVGALYEDLDGTEAVRTYETINEVDHNKQPIFEFFDELPTLVPTIVAHSPGQGFESLYNGEGGGQSIVVSQGGCMIVYAQFQ